MSNQMDDWHKLATFDTNLQGELHATLLKNNGVSVSLQALSAIPGMNSGSIVWVKQDDFAKAKQILDNIDKGLVQNDFENDLDAVNNDQHNNRDGEF